MGVVVVVVVLRTVLTSLAVKVLAQYNVDSDLNNQVVVQFAIQEAQLSQISRNALCHVKSGSLKVIGNSSDE